MAKQKTQEEVIAECVAIHKGEFTYERAVYVNAKTKFIVTCPKHGDFKVTPNNHKRGKGCPHKDCVSAKIRAFHAKSPLGWQEDFNKAHGSRYSLVDSSEYVNSSTPVQVLCATHGVFKITPASLLAGCGCPECAKLAIGDALRMSNSEAIAKVVATHGDRFTFDGFQYIRYSGDVTVGCKLHGNFTSPYSTLASGGHGCKQCLEDERSVKLELIRSEYAEKFLIRADSVHNNLYDYSRVKYVAAKSPVEIICDKHGVFLQTPDDHLSGRGCPQCAKTGFEPMSMGILYVFVAETMLKVGITNKGVSKRLSRLNFGSDEVFKVAYTYSGMGSDVRASEKELLVYLRTHYKQAPVSCGFTETFSMLKSEFESIFEIVNNSATKNSLTKEIE